jgi:uncharacterized protein
MDRSRRGSLLIFFAVTYAVMWTLFISVAVAVPARTPLGTVMILLGAYSPSMVALALTFRAEGRDGVVALLERLFLWQVPVRWYLFAALYMIAVKLTAALLLRAGAGAWPQFGPEIYVMPAAIVLGTPFQAGEEIGWRGYALPRLAERFGLARAGLILGVIWAGWHLPQFFIAGADTYGQSFPVYALQVTALSVAMTWLYARTSGSLLLMMLLHSAVNNSKDIVPSGLPGAHDTFGFGASRVAWLTAGILWLCAACFLRRMPASNGAAAATPTT